MSVVRRECQRRCRRCLGGRKHLLDELGILVRHAGVDPVQPLLLVQHVRVVDDIQDLDHEFATRAAGEVTVEHELTHVRRVKQCVLDGSVHRSEKTPTTWIAPSMR